ncbi:hypothetical protein [Anaerococcus rubeinfantis]|uniref:hypothetical protein n=1 Tax=Anaerococcus rubeinfantis TaxID=1720199 RepID=UPI00073F9C9F|nr:hypothetical protein [Anaerococcus rubeinfantis]
MSDKKYPVMMTRKEIEIITSIMDAYIDSCVKNHYIICDSDIVLQLNLKLKYRITDIKDEEAFAKLMEMGIKK